MARLPFWGNEPKLYDSILIGPSLFEYLPIDVSGEVGFKLDVRPAPGTDGAHVTNQGYEPAKIEIALSLYTEDHHTAFEDLLQVVRPRPGKVQPSPVEIFHPLIQLYGLAKFYIPKIQILKRDGPQSFAARLQCVEFFDRPKALGSNPPPVTHPTIWDGDSRPNPTPPSKTNTGP